MQSKSNGLKPITYHTHNFENQKSLDLTYFNKEKNFFKPCETALP